MAHDWGVKVPADLTTEQVIEFRDKLRAGTLQVTLPAGVQDHPKCAEWEQEMQTQMLAAYEKEAARRFS